MAGRVEPMPENAIGLQPRSGPNREEIKVALAEIEETSLPGTPSIGAVRTLLAMTSPPITVGQRTVTRACIQEGRPRHGEMRSDDHISSFEVQYREECPECGSLRACYSYDAFHFIAGSESAKCEGCGFVYHHEEWG